MIDKSKFNIKEITRLATKSVLMNFNYSYETITQDILDKMKKDSTIASCLNTRFNAIAGKEWRIEGESNKSAEIEKRFNNINFNQLIKKILLAKTDGYSIQELIFNEQGEIITFKNKPRNYFEYNYKDGFIFNNYGTTKIRLNDYRNKFLININDQDEIFLKGRSILEPLLKIFDIKENGMNQFVKLVKNYGEVIKWFRYDMNMNVDDVTAQAEMISQMGEGDTIGLPAMSNDGGYNKDFGFLTLDDFKSEVHKELLSYVNQEIKEVLLGTSSVEKGGSYASAVESGEIRKDIIDDDVLFVRDNLQQLIIIDSDIQGYNLKDFYFSLQDQVSEEKKQDILLKITQKYINSKQAGYQISVKQFSAEMGIPESEIEIAINQNTMFSEFSEKKKTISEEKIKLFLKLDKKFQDDTDKAKTVKLMSESILKKLEKVKTIDDIENFKADYPIEMEEDFKVSFLYGSTNNKRVNLLNKEFEDEDITDVFNKPYELAIKHFTSLDPQLFENIDDLEDMMSQNYFWIKKSTDLEVTKKMKISLNKKLDDGLTFNDWKKDIIDIAIKSGFGEEGYYLENIYRTNIQSSYNSGRQYNQELMKDDFPYVLYNAILDGKQSEICNELDGKVFKIGSLEYEKYYPPNHYQCRSSFIQLSKDDVKELDLSILKKDNKVNDLELGSFNGTPLNKNLKPLVRKKDKEVSKI